MVTWSPPEGKGPNTRRMSESQWSSSDQAMAQASGDIMYTAPPGGSPEPMNPPDTEDGSVARTRIWRLQYGPCWCQTVPSVAGSFDFARMRTTSTDLGPVEQNFLIVSSRVIDGTRAVFLHLYSDVPDPKIVISGPACPAARLFWDELPVEWTPVGEIIPVDIEVQHCISGNPEELMAAAVRHLLLERCRGELGGEL